MGMLGGRPASGPLLSISGPGISRRLCSAAAPLVCAWLAFLAWPAPSVAQDFRQAFDTGAGPVAVAIGDVNGDGRPDLATANSNAHTVSVLLGNGTGGFGAHADFASGLNPKSVVIGDLSGDGRPDLAAANNGSNTVSVL